jgi:hypothetical protein
VDDVEMRSRIDSDKRRGIRQIEGYFQTSRDVSNLKTKRECLKNKKIFVEDASL